MSKIDIAAMLADIKAKKAKKASERSELPYKTPIISTPTLIESAPPIPIKGATLHAATSLSLKERLAALHKIDREDKELTPTLINTEEISLESRPPSPTGMHGEAITYNAEQQKFIDIASTGKDVVLIGAAGTGKTTCSQGGILALIAAGIVPSLKGTSHKYLIDGTPGILIISFTRRAVNNIRKVQSDDMKPNCITSHKLLEYQPEYFEIDDLETGKVKKSMRFVPARNQDNPLPPTIHTIIVEEASMLSIELYEQIEAALLHKVQWIFIGDIQQLPPVFGPAILGFKLLELPVVELTTVYRQALESPIIRLAHRILSGEAIPVKEYPDWGVQDKLTIHPWKKKITDENALKTLAGWKQADPLSSPPIKGFKGFFLAAIDAGLYNPDEDMILIPFNKGVGTLEINKLIANYLAKRRGAITYEVVAGFDKHYLSPGDKVLYDREDAEILEIKENITYSGASYQRASKFLDYWGYNPNLGNEIRAAGGGVDMTADEVDFLLEAVASSEDRVTQASHELVIRLLDSGQELTINKAADINSLLHSYALTVHKSQGSEWRKVFLAFHHTHATMMQRELLYTAVTRAREELYVICEPETFTKGISSQKIKGNSLEEKAQFFKGKSRKF